MANLLLKKIGLFFSVLFILMLTLICIIIYITQSDAAINELEEMIEQVEIASNLSNNSIESTVINTPTITEDTIFIVDKKSGDITAITRNNEPNVDFDNADTKEEYLAILNSCKKGKLISINGSTKYLKTKELDDKIIGAYIEANTVYSRMFLQSVFLVISNGAMFICVMLIVKYHVKRYVLKALFSIEHNIKEFMSGNYDVSFEDDYDTEFRRIYEMLNDWKDSFKNKDERIGRIISNINSNVAVFECLYPINRNFFSDNMQSVLGVDDDLWSKINRTPKQFKEYTKTLMATAEGEDKIIKINNKFVSIVLFNEENEFYGMIIDRTEDVETKNRIKQELHYVQMESERDPLTKLVNRSGLEKHIRRSLEIENRKGMLLIFDLDNFKMINDELGHPEGDEVLKKFANCLKSFFRSKDVIGRMGGDEFVVFLEDSLPVEVISKKLESLLQIIHKDLGGYVEHYELSTSVGVAYVDNLTYSYEDLYKCADVALYMAKRLGKDRFYINEENILCMRNNCINCTKECKRKELLGL